MLDSARLLRELSRIQTALARLDASARGKGLLDTLRSTSEAPTDALLWTALYADCMRIAYSAVAADGDLGDEEVDALYDMLAAAARSYADVTPAEYREFRMIDRRRARAFLDRYTADLGPFGRGAGVRWPGLALCLRAAELDDRAAHERYQSTMMWLIAEACRIGGVTDDLRWQGRIDELDDLRRTLASAAATEPSTVARRVHAFLAPSGVFTAVQQACSIFENDPFDVDSIHREARQSFEQVVERARRPSQINDGGRMLLVIGESGCGKTHVLRGFRRHVQEYSRGFIAYAQLQSNSTDYARYLLQHLVFSLKRPYSGPSGQRTGLRELARGVVQLAGESMQARVKRLEDGTWDSQGNLCEYVDDLVNDLLRTGDLANFDPDLLRVMLYALRSDQPTMSRVYKYLSCENMTPNDRRWIGDVFPRTGEDDPHGMILNLGRLAAVTNRALVLMIDQVDLAGFDGNSAVVFRRAIDALYRITSELPSAVAVVACLANLYEKVSRELNRPALDRLESDPPIARLKIRCSYSEIEEVVARRLAWLFAQHGTVHRPETPVYPIPPELLRGLEGWRMRDVLVWCHQFQARCAASGRILDTDNDMDHELDREPERDLDQIAAMWNDAMHAQAADVPDEEFEILEVVGAAAQACADEGGLSLAAPQRDKGVLHVTLSAGSATADLAIAVTNNNPQRGSFAGQIDALLKRARKSGTPVAVRTLEFPRGESSDKVLASLVKCGGRRVYLDPSTLGVLAAFQRFRPSFPPERVMAWRRRDRPILSLAAVAALFDIERLRAALTVDAADSTSQRGSSVDRRPPEQPTEARPPATDGTVRSITTQAQVSATTGEDNQSTRPSGDTGGPVPAGAKKGRAPRATKRSAKSPARATDGSSAEPKPALVGPPIIPATPVGSRAEVVLPRTPSGTTVPVTASAPQVSGTATTSPAMVLPSVPPVPKRPAPSPSVSAQVVESDAASRSTRGSQR